MLQVVKVKMMTTARAIFEQLQSLCIVAAVRFSFLSRRTSTYSISQSLHLTTPQKSTGWVHFEIKNINLAPAQ
jgi:hypothetical protein